jgi:hypothetical protein
LFPFFLLVFFDLDIQRLKASFYQSREPNYAVFIHIAPAGSLISVRRALAKKNDRGHRIESLGRSREFDARSVGESGVEDVYIEAHTHRSRESFSYLVRDYYLETLSPEK